MDTPTINTCPTCSSWWRLPLLLGLVLAAILISHFWPSQRADNTGNVADAINGSARENVSLTIDFGDGRMTNVAGTAWHQGMTVVDLLTNAPGISVEQKGSGQAALLTSLDGVANQGADGKNWTFDVNDRPADRSFAVYELRAGDHVLWTFGLRR
jgi:hypothetical protein